MSDAPHILVLFRHGHTEWNLTNRFTGWTDVPLSEVGLVESEKAGLQLAEKGFQFTEAHISVLLRTRQALKTLLKAANHPEIPIYSNWRLNERHYGHLQGMNKEEIFSSYGIEKSYAWWRGYEDIPPALTQADMRHPIYDPKYADLDPTLLPASESLRQCKERLIPYWHQFIKPGIELGRRLIIVSHGNTLRSLRMLIENIDHHDIEKIEIPLGVPLVYELDKQLNPIKYYTLEQEMVVA